MQSEGRPDLSVIVVVHDDGPVSTRCLASATREASFASLRAELIVVDNASRDGRPEALGKEFPGLLLIRNSENRGFGAAVNQGFRASSGRRVLLLNPDAELDEGALGPLWDALDDPRVALAAPKLVLPDGTPQESPRRFYDLGAVAARRTPWGRTRAGRRAASEHLVDSGSSHDDVDWVTGAAMLLDRDAVPEQGPFDERYFLYFEDVDLCRRLHASGRRVAFRADARVSHRFGGASRVQVPWNRAWLHHVMSGARYALRWHAGWWSSRWWRAAAGRASSAVARMALLWGLALLLGLAPTPAAGAAILGALGTPRVRSSLVGRPPLPTPGRIAWGLLPAAAFAGALGTFSSVLVAWAVGATLLLHLGRRLLRSRTPRRTALIAGEPEAAAIVARSLAERPEERVDILGFVPRDPLCKGGPSPRLSDWGRVSEVAADQRCDLVLLAGSPEDLSRMAGGVAELRRQGVPSAFAMTGPTELLQAADAERLAGLPLLTLGPGADAPALARMEAFAQRMAAAAGLVFLAAPCAPLVVLSAAVFRGSPFVSVPRLGRDLVPFSMWRLRTGPGAGDQGGGRLGAFLRAMHLDELPQLYNVLRGDMALVGPRPVAPSTADRLDDWERARFAVRPGITGIWQLDRLRRWRLEEMVASDLLYLLRWSPSLDARLLAETLFGRRNP